MRRPYIRYQPPWVTDDGYPVKRAVLITVDPPGHTRVWSNLFGGNFRRTTRKVWRELRGVAS